MQDALQRLNELAAEHERQGRRLYEACAEEIFPCDALAFAVLERSLNLLKGFRVLLENGGYTIGAGVLRMQLDNVMRFHGVAASGDPHGVANLMANGVQLRKIKDSSGKKMEDTRLLGLLEARNPDIRKVYGLSSGYIHLSQNHINHFLLRSAKTDPDGTRIFAIGDDDSLMDLQSKLKLVEAFSAITRGVVSTIGLWVDSRPNFGSSADLRERFSHAV
jgi:hypothetical protein